MTRRHVADALDWSESKLIRIENGQVGLSLTDLKALLFHYEITGRDRVDELVGLLREGKQPAWWDQFKEFYPPIFMKFLGLESSAIRIRQFHTLVIPGLLQTPDYARAVISRDDIDQVKIERGLQVRVLRQELLAEDGPEMFFVIDEAVLHRVVGAADLMRGQLQRLEELSERGNITIQIIPFTAGVHSGMWSSFEIFELSEEENDFAMVIERPDGDELVEDATRTVEYVRIFQELEQVALSPADSIKLIERVLESMGAES